MIHLDLHGPSAPPVLPPVGAGLRSLAERALMLLVLALESGPETAERQEAVLALKRTAARLDDGGEPGANEAPLDPVETASLLTQCEEAIRLAANAQALQQTEMRAVVSVLREVVAAIAAANQTLEVHVYDSARRMTALGDCNDLHELKTRLAGEVTRMKRLAVENRQHWQATVAGFERRVSELEGQLSLAQKEASLDALTHLANRRAFDRMAGQWLNSSGTPVLLAIVDLDNLKTLNDTGGHQLGDLALKRVATALRASVRAKDLVARIGGDEFALVAAGLSIEQAQVRLQRVVSELAAMPLDPDTHFRVSVTTGLALSTPGDTIASLLTRADRALYRGKRSGKSGVFVDPPTPEPAH